MVLERLARQWIAGADVEKAIDRAKGENRLGIRAIINYLGEHVSEGPKVEAAKEEYLRLLKRIEEEGIEGCISVKPTQLGLAVGRDYCLSNFQELVAAAKDRGGFVWLDMEGSRYTQDILKIYSALVGSGCAGVAIQAYLKRSKGDVEALLQQGGSIRLVKGAYRESPAAAFQARGEIDSNYSSLMRLLFKGGRNFAIATHDDKLIEEAAQLGEARRKDFEFEMLLGIRGELKGKLVERGYSVASYIPYGKEWLPYSFRRIRERKRNLILIARSLLGG